MVEQLTADLMEAFIYGLIAALISASIFEHGIGEALIIYPDLLYSLF